MDSDSYRREQITKEDSNDKNDGPKQEKNSGNRKPNVRNVFPSIGIRRAFFNANEADKFLLDCGFYFVLPISAVLYSVFFLFS